ncbi:TPX4 family protein [Megaselia abdita]
MLSYSPVFQVDDENLGKSENSMRLGTVVPNFKAQTTDGPIEFYDWQGDSWVLIFSHPADFTPVCTTEIGHIAAHTDEFKKRNTKIIAHSVDRLKTHHDWIDDIKSYCSNVPEKFPFPIIADTTRELAVQFNMIAEEDRHNDETAQSVRALFIIGPDHKVRLSMYYPNSAGRNLDEIIRALDSLQLTEKLKVVATPANWTPGTKVMILPHVSDIEAEKLFPGGIDKVSMPSGGNYIRTTEKY